MKTIANKMTSRKWLAAIVGVIYSMTATGGYDMPVSEVVLIDALFAIYIIVEGFVDMFRIKYGK